MRESAPHVHVRLQVPYLRFGVIAAIVVGLGLWGWFPPVEGTPYPTEVLRLVAAVLFVFAVVLVISLIRFVRGPFDLKLDAGRLAFPAGRTPAIGQLLREIPAAEVVAIGTNLGKDHLVIRTRTNRYLLPYYWLPRDQHPRDLAAELARSIGCDLHENL